MKIDPFGSTYFESDEVSDLLYKNPNINLSTISVINPEQYNHTVRTLYADFDLLQKYIESTESVEEYDKTNQRDWFMPNEYKNLDIAQWVLDQCHNDAELQRAGQELLMFCDRSMLDLLRYSKYLVDTFRKNNIVWGVGRGSSVASFVLYKIGLHKINSLYYQLSIEEFLK